MGNTILVVLGAICPAGGAKKVGLARQNRALSIAQVLRGGKIWVRQRLDKESGVFIISFDLRNCQKSFGFV